MLLPMKTDDGTMETSDNMLKYQNLGKIQTFIFSGRIFDFLSATSLVLKSLYSVAKALLLTSLFITHVTYLVLTGITVTLQNKYRMDF